MINEPRALIRIAQFGAIKVFPSLINILMIPILHAQMGAGPFGAFSTFLSYALLSITVLGAIVTQPMYRFHSSEWEGLSKFNGFAIFAGAIGSVVGFAFAYLTTGRSLEGWMGAFFVFSAVIYTTLAVRYQVQGSILRLVTLEGSRVSILFLLVLFGTMRSSKIDPPLAIAAFWLSYFLPLLPFFRDLNPSFPSRTWINEKVKYGYLSAIWLLLAGLPLAFSKSIIAGYVDETEIGAFTANLDIYYRIFSMWNIAIAMWAFPSMSAAFDAGERDQATRIYRFGVLAYLIGGLGAVAAIIAMGSIFRPFPAAMQGGLVTFAILVVSCFVWQSMSLVHKPLEMSARLHLMIGLMALSIATFCGSAMVLIELRIATPSVSLLTALCLAGLIYCSSVYVLNQSSKI